MIDTKLLILLISVSTFTSACKPDQRAELCGTYIANYPLAHEQLDLGIDGVFRQIVRLRSADVDTITKGEWSYNSNTGYVTFHKNFMFVINGFGEFDPDFKTPPDMVVFLPAYKLMGNLYIGSGDGARGIRYKKTKT